MLEAIATILSRYTDFLAISPQDLETLKADALCFRYVLKTFKVEES
jgi:hypothetical protein